MVRSESRRQGARSYSLLGRRGNGTQRLARPKMRLWTESWDMTRYFCRPDSSDFSMRTVAAGYALRISLLRLLASASLSRSEIVRTLGTPRAKTR
jgi:hypothetical protein